MQSDTKLYTAALAEKKEFIEIFDFDRAFSYLEHSDVLNKDSIHNGFNSVYLSQQLLFFSQIL